MTYLIPNSLRAANKRIDDLLTLREALQPSLNGGGCFDSSVFELDLHEKFNLKTPMDIESVDDVLTFVRPLIGNKRALEALHSASWTLRSDKDWACERCFNRISKRVLMTALEHLTDDEADKAGARS